MDVPTRYPDDVAIAAGAAVVVEVSAEKRSKH